MRDLYQVLGVPRNAEEATIKKAYKKLARKTHPDRSDDPRDHERFKEVSAAYEVLGDKKRRGLYDEFGEVALRPGFDPSAARAWQHGGQRGPSPFEGGFDFDDLFRSLWGEGGSPFGGRGSPFGAGWGGQVRQGPIKGRDLEQGIRVPLLEAIRGCTVTVQIVAGGQAERLKVKVPPGTDQGSVIRLRGKGEPSLRGGVAGDVMLKIDLEPHPCLKRDGLDLEMEVPVTIHEALAGGAIEVPTFDGSVRVTVPKGMTQGKRLRLKGKGVRRGTKSGDLYLVLQPVLPPTDEPRALDLAEELETFYGASVRSDLTLD
ncbi:MAG: DnaJ C-terminal domain-containing protein [Myxococcota bacterium]|nr:DnaJ C-terminal domain-containing protein [Myxococcota bacterium]